MKLDDFNNRNFGEELQRVDDEPKKDKETSIEVPAQKSTPSADKRVKKPKKRLFIVAAIVIVMALIAAGLIAVAVVQHREIERLRSPEAVAEIARQETSDLVNKVSALIQLPDEDPTIATVEDITKLKEQPFFADAQNGDKVLIFSVASQAVIYRDSENRIINAGPIAITAEAETTEQPEDTPAQ